VILSPYGFRSAFPSHSLLFPPTLPPSSFLVLGCFSKGYFSSTGTFTGMWAVKLKIHYFGRVKSFPSKSKAIWIAFLDHQWKHILLLHVTVSWSHISLPVASLYLLKIAPLWLITYRNQNCIAGFGRALHCSTHLMPQLPVVQNVSEAFLRAAGWGSSCFVVEAREGFPQRRKDSFRVILQIWTLQEQVFPWVFVQPQTTVVNVHGPAVCVMGSVPELQQGPLQQLPWVLAPLPRLYSHFSFPPRSITFVHKYPCLIQLRAEELGLWERGHISQQSPRFKAKYVQLLVVAGKPKSCVQEHQKVGKRAPRCAKMLSAACQTHLTLSYHSLGWGLSKIWHNGFARAGTDCAICLKMLHTKLRTKLQTKLQTCMWDFTRTTSPQAGWLQAKCHTHRRTSKGAARCSQTEMRPNSLPAAVPEVPSQTNCLSSVYSSYQAQWLSRKADMRTKQRDCTAFTCDACVAIPFLNK